MKKIYFYIFICSIHSLAQAQTTTKGWHLLDYEKDSVYGISLQKAYHFLAEKKNKPQTIVVAVIDSGIDTLQEDLKNVLWHNPKEIPFNNIDDDKNGYVDDYFGWNFLGNKNGLNLSKAADENTRIYYDFKQKFYGEKIDESKLNETDKTQYHQWLQAQQALNINSDEILETHLLSNALTKLKFSDSVLKKELLITEYTAQQLEKTEPKTAVGKKNKLQYLTTLQLLNIEPDETNTALINQLDEYVHQKKAKENSIYQAPPNYRKDIIGDDYNNLKDKFYGNPNVTATAATHGTHVAGIIGAERNNNLGIDGVADHVKLMAIRIVPDGDEYDKDVALAIFYAVNNGAKIINMSFGKELSPQKYWVDSALQYAASKDVLVVHAAGNDSRNVDSLPSFPTAYLLNNDEPVKNFICVGASTTPTLSGKGVVVAEFSNYGKKSVDVFAPGVQIYSTVDGANNYRSINGTSMAAPVVSGIAALIRSYFPSLSAIQTKDAIMQSAIIPVEVANENLLQNSKIISLQNACKTEGIVNAAKAIEFAYVLDIANYAKSKFEAEQNKKKIGGKKPKKKKQ